MITVILILYTLALFVVFLYAISQLQLIFYYWKAQKLTDFADTFDFQNEEEIPYVTIQLPLYNEEYVVERLLKNIVQLDYPQEKLDFQVLDDSTDDSVLQTHHLVEQLKTEGYNIKHIIRSHRKGFKAGALKEGLAVAKGEFIAIFDADFIPKEDWLQQTIPYFKNEKIGVVQTRWEHLNRDYSLLTKVQAFALDFHFVLEQVGRSFGNHFINFNGTAGVWRKSCILDAGNWQGDTLTEDLDLSYRAQLKGWKFKYLQKVETPAELPITISAARSQQFRWNKGAAENFQKNYSRLFKSKQVSLMTKFHGSFHLLNSSMFLLVLIIAVLSVPVLYINNLFLDYSFYFYVMAFFGLATVIFFMAYGITFFKIHGINKNSVSQFIGLFFAFFSIAMGLSVHNTWAILEGHFGKKSSFVRTPKFNITNLNEIRKENKSLKNSFNFIQIIELILCFYFAFAIYSAFKLNDYGFLIFHFMLFFGFGFVVSKSFFPNFRFLKKLK
ncbi:cellulose synthase family protein [Mesonia aestuariivivens]|uniref:Glycosyltransferase family 2 protein n=1 Tax=Mesonia aestuariivivens TaxID=2796128 RepID=A0ABS6VZG6_9FLAO|nr:cellulose synthase family protein [Mesonia aestuariivivens]MBW2960991.1 glycosyltransferase family 2 protein [Mesonia aestuariivivens]